MRKKIWHCAEWIIYLLAEAAHRTRFSIPGHARLVSALYEASESYALKHGLLIRNPKYRRRKGNKQPYYIET